MKPLLTSHSKSTVSPLRAASHTVFRWIRLLLICGSSLVSLAQTASVSYQGRLTDGTQPANGSYDLRFTVHDAVTGGSAVGVAVELPNVAVVDGLFSVALDFGAGAFDGAPRWLEMGIRPGGSVEAYTALLPRTPLMASPYAL